MITDHREDARREIKIAIKLLAKRKRVYGIPLCEVLDIENRKGQIPYLIEASTGYLMANGNNCFFFACFLFWGRPSVILPREVVKCVEFLVRWTDHE